MGLPSQNVMLLEFNELTPKLMGEFMAAGHLPNFKRLFQASHTYVTDAEEAPPNLEPWIQWVTVHTGLSYRQHGIFDLGDGHKLKEPRIWDLVSQEGKCSFVCGSMNASFQQPFSGALLPDFWSTGVDPYPSGEYEDYFHFVRTYVQEYSADRTPVTKAMMARFLVFMASHGLSANTGRAILNQLLAERSSKVRWKRATILDRLQWDLFQSSCRRLKPAFATFFLNSTAHFQHVYWRNMDPEPFELKPTDAEQQQYATAVLYGYQQMDELVGRALALAGADTTIVFSSALGQQPCLVYESAGGKTFYKPRDPDHLFLDFLGLPRTYVYAAVMSEQFHLYMASEEEARATHERLSSIHIGDQPVFASRFDGREVFAGCRLFLAIPPDAIMTDGGSRSAPFFRYLYKVDITKSGMHHPDGMLWVRTPSMTHSEGEGKVSLRDVAPTLLRLLGLQQTAAMTGAPLPEVIHDIEGNGRSAGMGQGASTSRTQPSGALHAH